MPDTPASRVRRGLKHPVIDADGHWRDLPADGLRLKQKATGIAATVVVGKIILRDGEHTGAVPGRVLRGPLADAR